MGEIDPPPRVRLHLTITDVGPPGTRRGAEVMILAESEEGPPKVIAADSLDAALDLLCAALKPQVRRLLWGADQPPPS